MIPAALSIHESDRPLVDLTHNDEEAGPSGTVKEEPADERIIPHEHFYQHYARIERHGPRYFSFSLSLV
jgi:hypothetical protein